MIRLFVQVIAVILCAFIAIIKFHSTFYFWNDMKKKKTEK